ncbi:GerAB/ArcD/ProY family transporter [Bacillus sp. 165]|uniref:GerAB/ArcD/ProY family transporter n=1 Tax=Bacillus sp. 165 TaxID=1529117 RepID=UPI001ADB30B3|nr:GerAB/ArcD/ProY family transporter [Bacillus sp. 165]MBO9129772.1 GerAB/ArcD/ProY family transporter [Bacillus sp. 165]
MKQTVPVPNNCRFEGYLIMFAVIATQFGIGIFVFQRFVYIEAKQDAWIGVILAGLYAHLTMFVITKTLQKYKNKDLYEIHHLLFGKWLGTVLNAIFITYCTYAVLMVIVTYREVLCSYLFENAPMWFVLAIFFPLCIYAIVGGIRVIIGLCFFSVIISTSILFVLYQLFPYFNMSHFFPLLEASPKQLLKSTYQMSLSLAGFELIYVYYPYVRNPEKAQRFGQLGILITNSIFLYIIILSLGFFGGKDLIKAAWPTLTMFNMIRFPFLEQYQVIVLCVFMVAVGPILCMYLWSLTKGMKKLFYMKQRTALYVICGVISVVAFLFQTRTEVFMAGTYFNKAAFYVVFIYPYVLFIFSSVIDKLKTHNKSDKQLIQ